MGTLGLFCIWFLLLENYAEHVVSMEPGAVQSLHFPLFRNGLVEIIDARGLSTHRTLDPFVNNLPLETKFLAGKYPKTSIVAACKERLTQLRQVFQGWLSLRGLCQIILVDWSSSESLYRFVLDTIQQTPSKVQVTMVRVENARNWSLAQAYNLAVSFATGEWILKLDCDTWIDPLFLSKHPFQNDTFYSASVSSEGYLHGVFYMPREIFCRMGGFDERIQSYGWEDDCLLERVKKYLYVERIQSGTIAHIPHPKELRLKYQSCLLGTDCLPELEIQFNRIRSKFSTPWTGNETMSQYSLFEYNVSNSTRCIRLWRREPIPMPLLSPLCTQLAKTKAIRITLNTRYGFPPSSMRTWSPLLLEKVIRQLIRGTPLLLVIANSCHERTLLHLLETLSSQWRSSHLIMVVANNSHTYTQIVQNGFPVVHCKDTSFTDWFQNPDNCYCLAYQIISNNTLDTWSNHSMHFNYHHWILS